MILYTAITRDKDTQRDDIKVIPDWGKFTNPVMNAKIYKILPHKFFDDEITFWIDGNIFPLQEPPYDLPQKTLALDNWYLRMWRNNRIRRI